MASVVETCTAELVKQIARLRKAPDLREAGVRRVQTARKAFGLKENSDAVVLLAKVLHFLAPELVPLCDRKVAKKRSGSWAFRAGAPASVFQRRGI